MSSIHSNPSIKGNSIFLRPIIDSDYPFLFAWRNDTSSLFLWSVPRRLISFSEYTRSIHQAIQSDIDVWLMIIDNQNNIPVGFVYSYDSNTTDQHAFLAMYIDSSVRGKKIGLETGAFFVQYLFDYFPYEKLYADVFEYNPISQSFIRNYGFVQEGFFPKHRYFQGKSWGLYRLALYRDTWNTRRDEVFNKIMP